MNNSIENKDVGIHKETTVGNEIWGLLKMPDIAKREYKILKKNYTKVLYVGMYKEYPVFAFHKNVSLDEEESFLGAVDDGKLHDRGVKFFYFKKCMIGYSSGVFNGGLFATGVDYNDEDMEFVDFFFNGMGSIQRQYVGLPIFQELADKTHKETTMMLMNLIRANQYRVGFSPIIQDFQETFES